MSETLKPCPFCGKQPAIARGGPSNLVWFIECGSDDVDVPDHSISIQNSVSRCEAIAAWNTRTDPQREAKRKAVRP